MDTSIAHRSHEASRKRLSTDESELAFSEVTFLFSDVEGFTQLTRRLGDLRAYRLMARHRAIVQAQASAWGGETIELRGDGFLLGFDSARAALGCAVRIQESLELDPRHGGELIRVRMGLHSGAAIRDSEKYFGQSVILCARIADKAQAGEILVSAQTKLRLEGVPAGHFGAGREVDLKGFPGLHWVFSVLWQRRRESETAATANAPA